GDPAVVSNSGSASAAIFDFAIPQGATGPAGSAANATNPINNSMVVFGSNVVSPPDLKSPDAPVTSTQSLLVTRTSTTQDSLISLTRVGANTTGLVMQVLPTADVNAL